MECWRRLGSVVFGVACTLIPSLIAVGIGLSLTSSGVFIAQTCANSFLRDAAPAGTRVSAAGLYICSYYIGGTVGGILSPDLEDCRLDRL